MIRNDNESSSAGRGTDSMNFVSKEIYELNDSSWDIGETKGSEEHGNHKVMNELSMDCANEKVDSTRKDGQNGLLHNPVNWDKDTVSLSSNRFDKEKDHESQEHECLMIADGRTDLFQTETNPFADKSMLDCELPELEVCYKEIDPEHTVKDICVDEGKPEKDCGIFNKMAKEGLHKEILPSVEEISLVKNNGISPNQYGSEEQQDMTSATDVSKYTHIEDSAQTGEAATTDFSEEKSLMDKKIPVEEFGTRNFLRSLDSEEIAVKQWPSQIAEEEVASKSPPVTLTNEEAQGEVVPRDTKSSTTEDDDVIEQSVGVSDKDKNEDNIPNDKSHDVSHGDKKEGNLSDDKVHDLSGNSPVQLGSAQTAESDASKVSTHDLCGNNRLGLGNAHTVETDAPKNDRWTSGVTSVVGRMQKDDGETSFSAASLINYSEPVVPFSGSISHRSDSSATSARSFAFPVLQTEWNSSPVRMAKANRKHRCWRSGLFCCRF